MLLHENRFIGFMATDTELGNRVFEKGCAFVRGMCLVAGQAILFNR